MMPPLATNVIYQGDVLTRLRDKNKFPDKSIRCCVTSPPYYGLRHYGTAIWIGGDEKCDHKKTSAQTIVSSTAKVGIKNAASAKRQYEQKLLNKEICNRCGATRLDMQIGLEKTPELYIKKLVRIFREVKRILTDDGTLWLNIGDSYASTTMTPDNGIRKDRNQSSRTGITRTASTIGLKPKDLIGIPWMLAFALRKDGWYLRSEIIWHKPNPMPESVTDRPTKAHENIFLFSKSPKYYYDHVAIRTPIKDVEDYERRINAQTWDNKSTADKLRNGIRPRSSGNLARKYGDAVDAPEGIDKHQGRSVPWEGMTANKKTVWTVSTKPFAEAHFATFPEDLIVDCIKAGTSEHGQCSQCGKPWVRITEKELKPTAKASFNTVADQRDAAADKNDQSSNRVKDGHQPGYYNEHVTKGWRPSCECNGKLIKHRKPQEPQPIINEDTEEVEGYEPQPDIVWHEYVTKIPLQDHPVIPDTVLDIFGGAGTTMLVAKKLHRNAVIVELNPAYIHDITVPRLQRELGMFYNIKVET